MQPRLHSHTYTYNHVPTSPSDFHRKNVELLCKCRACGGERVFGPKISHGSLTFNAVAFGAAYLFVIPATVPRCSGGNYARENIERVDTSCGHAIMSHACTVANSYQKMTASCEGHLNPDS